MKRIRFFISTLICLFASVPVLAQFDISLTRSSTPDSSTAASILFASQKGRALTAQGWTLKSHASRRISFWYGQLGVLATGHFKGDEFSTVSDRFGIRAVLRGVEQHGLMLQYDGWRSGKFMMVGPNSSAALPSEVTRLRLPGVQTDVLSLQYAFGRTQIANSPNITLPIYQLSTNIGSVRAVDHSAVTVGLGSGVLFHITRGITGRLGATGYLQTADGPSPDRNRRFKPDLVAGLAMQPARWARLQAGIDVMPLGIPFAGTSLSGMSGVLLYQPGGVASGLGSSRFAAFHVELLLSTHF